MLGQRDPQRAAAEMGEVAQLSRRALADVPVTTDMVDEGAQELFGWVVREGLANGPARPGPTLHRGPGPTWVEIIDDGVGNTSRDGNGLTGLRERVEAVGARHGPAPGPPADDGS